MRSGTDPQTPSLQAPSQAPSNLRAHLLLVVVQLLFATFPVAGKMALEGFDELAIATYRVLFGGLVLLFLARRLHPNQWRLGPLLPRVCVMSLFGVSINQVLFIEGLSRSTAVTAGLMMAVIPAATYGFALLLGQEQFRRIQIVGLIVAFTGAAMLALFSGAAGNDGASTLLGNLFLFGNSLSYAFFLVLARPVHLTTPPLVLTAWTFLLAIPVVPVIGLIAGTSFTSSIGGLGPMGALVWILVFPTALSYFLIGWALVRLPASIIALYVYLQPVIGVLLAVLILNESVKPEQMGGGLLVMAGIYLVSGRRSRSR